MKKLITQEVMYVLEERFSPSLNYRSKGITDVTPPHQAGYFERSGAFERARPLENTPLAPNAALAAVAQLAEHLSNSRTPPYRIRQEAARTSSPVYHYYVPAIGYELHFDALDLLLANPNALKVLERSCVLNPLIQALIAITRAVLKVSDPFKSQTWEECKYLSKHQMCRNLVSMRVAQWISRKQNKESLLLWNRKHQEEKKKYLDIFNRLTTSHDSQVLRGELRFGDFSERFTYRQPLAALQLAKILDQFRKKISDHPALSHCAFHLDPYLDLSLEWQLPWTCVASAEAATRYQLRPLILDLWREIVGPGWIWDLYSANDLACSYRFISEEQRMLDSPETQMTCSAAYHFDAQLIADTRLSTIVKSSSSLNELQPSRWGNNAPLNGELHRSICRTLTKNDIWS